MLKSILTLTAIAAFALLLGGCRKSDEAAGDANAAGASATQGIQPGQTKQAAGGGGAGAPDQAVAAPDWAKTGTPTGK